VSLKPAGLVAAQALFLWMFFAAAPLEQLASAGMLSGYDVRNRAFAFAAEWRHGMAGNSPLYMPGFFAVAVASWLFVEGRRPSMFTAFAIAFTIAIVIAGLFSSHGANLVVSAFAKHSGVGVSGGVPFPAAAAAGAAAYTLATWTAFVIGVRASLLSRSWLPLLPVPLLTAGLIALRPWTVDTFTATWWMRIQERDVYAVASAVAIPVVGWWLARRAPQRQSARPDFAKSLPYW
jgi:hypothetical protein